MKTAAGRWIMRILYAVIVFGWIEGAPIHTARMPGMPAMDVVISIIVNGTAGLVVVLAITFLIQGITFIKRMEA